MVALSLTGYVDEIKEMMLSTSIEDLKEAFDIHTKDAPESLTSQKDYQKLMQLDTNIKKSLCRLHIIHQVSFDSHNFPFN